MSIQEHLNKIRNAIYGKEVRESIAKGIETAYDDASENGNANMEVKIARGTHPNLRSRLEEVDNKQQQTTAQLAQKATKGDVSVHDINKNRGLLDETFMTEEFRQQMVGDTPLHSIPADDSVTYKKLTAKSVLPHHLGFAELTKNLFNGIYYRGFLRKPTSYGTGEDYYFTNANDIYNVTCAIIPIEANEAYTVSIVDNENNRLAIGVHNSKPIFQDIVDSSTPPNEESKLDTILLDDSNYDINSGFTFTNDANGKYVIVYVSSAAQEPKLQIERGAERTPYQPSHLIPENFVELSKELEEAKNMKKIDVNENLYNPSDYVEGIIRSSDGRLSGIGESPGLKVVYVKIKNNETYTITPDVNDETWNRTRYSLFDSLEEGRLLEYRDTLLTDDDYKSSFTFTNDLGAKYLGIYLSNIRNVEPVKCMVNKGSESLPYIRHGYVIEGSEMATLDDVNKIEQTKESNVVFDINERLLTYLPAEQSNEPVAIHTSNKELVYERYDALLNAYPDYISKSILEHDGLGNPIYQYSFKPPTMTASNTPKMPKVLVVCAVHGNEKSFPFAVPAFLKDMCENWEENDVLSELRWNVQFEVIPVANPSGFDAYTRENHEGININRNFELNFEVNGEGEVPFSTKEAQAIKKFVDNNQDAQFMLDCHNFSARPTDVYFWFPLVHNDLTIIGNLNQFSKYLTKRLAKRYDWIPGLPNIIAYSNYNPNPSINSYAYSKGLESYVLEILRRAKWDTEGANFDHNNIQTAMEYFGNFTYHLFLNRL